MSVFCSRTWQYQRVLVPVNFLVRCVDSCQNCELTTEHEERLRQAATTVLKFQVISPSDMTLKQIVNSYVLETFVATHWDRLLENRDKSVEYVRFDEIDSTREMTSEDEETINAKTGDFSTLERVKQVLQRSVTTYDETVPLLVMPEIGYLFGVDKE